MASSMLTGERRWVSARRGGMTVLGKVAVPKPVNLPSQRSENHGLDPNVEIVPKGTLSWGSRSSSASNAWGSSALSPPNTGGGASRPSSGGSGTRPSTAGSDRSHEPTPNAWGLSSRPSSASGVFVPNQTSTGTRPRSADTRPGSSQLSRFAEPVSENSVAWGASGNTEKLAHSSSKINAFSLSSGDFPTLGSEKSAESHMQEDHSSQGCPVSASGVATSKEKLEILHTDDESVDANRDRGPPNAWKRDSSPYDGGAPPASMEKWQRETHPFLNPNMPPQHFDPWHGGPVRAPPDGVWYRPSGGPPYGSPGPPGNYPVEPFAYYHPHLPARPLTNSQAVPRPGSGPGGYHLRNGDAYRPHMPDSYVHPIMPVRAAVYPGQVPYDGYYGPPHVLCSSSERDAPVMGMATGPCVYGGYPIQNVHPDSGNFHARPGGYGPTSTNMTKEHVESGHPQGSHRGPYKVLLKQHDGWEANDGKEKREQEHAVVASARPLERGSRPGTPMKENVLAAERRNADPVDFSKTVSGEVSSQSADSQGSYCSVPVDLNLIEGTNKAKKVDDGVVKKPETSTVTREGPHPLLSFKKTPLDKGLTSKAQISEDRYDAGHVPTREEKMKPSRVVNAKADHSTNEPRHGIVFAENTSTSRVLTPTHDVSASAGDKRPEPTIISGPVVSRSGCDSAATVLNTSGDGEMSQSNMHRRAQGLQSRVDNRGKGRFNTQEGEEWRKKSLVADSPVVVPVKNVETCSNVRILDHDATEATEKSDSNLQGKGGGELHATTAFDPIDYKVQRAKMREIAAQRAKQLQKEEEERTREQKAKALAKLEELNRRALAESTTEKLEHALPLSGALEPKQESNAGPSTVRSSVPSSDVGWNSDSVTEMINDTSRIGESTEFLKNAPLKASVHPPQDPVVTNNLPLSSSPPQEGHTADFTNQRAAPQVHDTFVTKQKQMGYKKKQNIPLDKNSNDKSIPTGKVGGTKSHGKVVGDANVSCGESSLPNNTNATDDASPQQKKKNSRSGKNKNKLDEVSSGLPTPSSVPLEVIPAKASAEISKPKASGSVLDGNLVQAPSSKENSEARDSQDVVTSAEQGWFLPTEEAHGRVNNHWKPQAPRRTPRNTQGTRSTEKFHNNDVVVWAPVRSQNKNEASDEPSDNAKTEVHTSTTNGNGVQNHQKSRRAEIERYVPKPVAKELSQQGNTQRPSSPSVNKAVSNETTGRAEPDSLTTESSASDGPKVGFTVVSKNGESKNSKHGKTQGLWRQRGSSTESPVVDPSHEGSSFSSDQSKIVEKPIEQQQYLKPETLIKGQAKDSDNWNPPGNPISTEPVTVPVVVKDHGVANRGKRQPFKGNKVTAQSHNASDLKDLHGGDSDKTARDLSQSDGKTILVENHGIGEHASSHWQPKSQPYPVQNRQGNRAHGGQRVSSQVGRASENEFPTQAGGRNPAVRNVKDNSSGALVQPHADQPNTGVPSVSQQEAKKERNDVDLSKGAAHSSNQVPINSAKSVATENIDTKNEQSFSSGSRRHGQHNGRFGRGAHEASHGGRSSAVQDNTKQQQQPASSDRRRTNAHYEYQPARSYTNEPNESFEGGGGSRGMGSRYRGRGGQTHSRRGGSNVYGRNGGTVQVAAAYSNGE
ncbi:hypothetical protein BVC80_887g44 [Macleaya cordata]|uniref:BAT2 N-terminal domain-containing protein n=1 Tax=Macleaya cordata TaxID=56857 RepID=A0A200RDI1_MACCD|nr:hypothetical protein BVC80_887g44 [Macleaya cordata]